ncbi:MAG: 2-hydroxyacid dehydrogenase [Burkholderiales bacterium]|nr:2-hydroxyacid dehydrogenase [Burkholderiales bacterium]
MKPVVLVTGPIFPKTREILEREFTCHRLYEATDRAALLKEVGREVRGLATFGPWGADAALIDALPALEIISNFGVGVDAIDLEAARRRGIVVTNTPEVLDDCVADTAIALVLNTLRRFPQAERWLRSGHWASRGAYPLATALRGKTMGVLGLGRIGEAIARRALAFGMKVRYHNRRPKAVAYPYDPDPVTLAKNSDVLVVATPGGPETRGLVDARVLDALGPEGYLVNISRGSVVDEPVLLAYLKAGKIAGAGLDVFDNEPNIDPEWFALENAVAAAARRQRHRRDAHRDGDAADREPAPSLRRKAGEDAGRLRRASAPHPGRAAR